MRVKNNQARDLSRRTGGKGKFIKDVRSQRNDSAAAFAARTANAAQQVKAQSHRALDQSRAARAAAVARQAAFDSRRNERELYRAGEIEPDEATLRAYFGRT